MTSNLEAEFLTRWQQLAPTAPEPTPGYKFIDTRRFRFDFAWVEQKVAVEMVGAVYTQGRHSRGAGMEGDYEKNNLAMALGWRVFYLTGGMLRTDPIRWIALISGVVAPTPMVYKQTEHRHWVTHEVLK